MVASRTASLEKHVSQGHSVICTYNISDVEKRGKLFWKLGEGSGGGKGNKDILSGQDFNWFTCGLTTSWWF